MAKGFAASASHPGPLGIVSRMVPLTVIKTMASTTRSDNAVVRTKARLMPDRLLIIMVRTTSPARAGRTLLPRYPADVAQNASGIVTRPSAVRRTRQRTDRRKSASDMAASASATSCGCARRTVVQTRAHSMPRSE